MPYRRPLIAACITAFAALSATSGAAPAATISTPLTNVGAERMQDVARLIQRNQLDEALRQLDALEKAEPRNPDVSNLKARIYMARGDLAKARSSFERALGLKADSIDAQLGLAGIDLREKKPEAARKRYDAILAIDRNNVNAMLGMAAAATEVHQDAEAVAWLEKAAAASPAALEPRLLLAKHYLMRGDARKAVAVAEQARAYHRDNPQVLDTLATAQLAAGDISNAVVTYGRLAELQPSDPHVQYKLASAYAAASDTTAARKALDRALELKADHLASEMALASLELTAGRHSQALRIARDVQKQYPTNTAGYGMEGDVRMAQKDYAAALKAYEKAFALDRNDMLATKVHSAQSAGGDVAGADARLLQWLKERPNDTAVRAYLAGTYARSGRYQPAIEQYELLAKANPKSVIAWNDLAWLYQQQKDPRALETAERAFQIEPENARVLDTLGWILYDGDQTARAVQLLQKAVDKAPDSAEVRYHYAAALAKSGDKPKARRQLEDLLARDRNFPQRAEAQALLKQL